ESLFASMQLSDNSGGILDRTNVIERDFRIRDRGGWRQDTPGRGRKPCEQSFGIADRSRESNTLSQRRCPREHGAKMPAPIIPGESMQFVADHESNPAEKGGAID